MPTVSGFGDKMSSKDFQSRKDGVLRALASQKDKSRKGGVDASIADLIARINSHPSFFTTSSCSGRISLFLERPSGLLTSDPYRDEGNGEERARVKKGGDWIYVSHDSADADEIIWVVRRLYQAIDKDGVLVFRFEPFILALECRALAAAQQLVTCARISGFRESGISSIGNRITMSVRSSIRLEIPIGDKRKLIVPEEYIKYIASSAKEKFALNQQRIERFSSLFSAQVCQTIAQPIGAFHESIQALDTKAGRRRGKLITSKVRDRLLLNLAKRQSKILLKIDKLEAHSGLVSGVAFSKRPVGDHAMINLGGGK